MESSSSSSSSSKRAKAPGNMMSTQVGHCLVDGCNADLRVCRDYHRRHKVCEVHSKTPKVTIGGREQRFCQQCSRFHSLVEFDEGKRSCRKRLDGHNRRRRKPQPDSLSRNSGLVFSSPPQAAALLSFSSPQVLPPPSILGSAWTGLVKPETDMMLYNNNNNNNYQQQQMNNYIHRQNSFQECSSQSYKCVNQLLDPNAAAAASGSSNNGRKIFSEQERALSLLSPPPPPPSTTTREFGLNHPESVPLVHNYSYCSLGHQYPSAQESKEVVSSTGSHSTDPSSALHIPDMYQPGPDGSSTSGSHQTLTFMWE